MSNIEKNHNNQITGYVHPNTPSNKSMYKTSNKSMYKTFNTESKENVYVTAETKNPYAVFTHKKSSIKNSEDEY